MKRSLLIYFIALLSTTSCETPEIAESYDVGPKTRTTTYVDNTGFLDLEENIMNYRGDIKLRAYIYTEKAGTTYTFKFVCDKKPGTTYEFVHNGKATAIRPNYDKVNYKYVTLKLSEWNYFDLNIKYTTSNQDAQARVLIVV